MTTPRKSRYEKVVKQEDINRTNRSLFLKVQDDVDMVGTGVENLAALAAISETRDNMRVLVQTVRDYYELDKTSTATVDGITIIAAVGGGRWLRVGNATRKWIARTSWYVDPATGNDENDGTSPTPLKTIGEWYRRTGGHFSGGDTSMFLIGTNPWQGDAWLYNVTNENKITFPLAFFHIYGTRTVVTSGTFTAVSAVSPTTADGAAKVTDTTKTWSTYVDKGIVVTSGAVSGATSWVDADLGSNQARVAPWSHPTSLVTASAAPSIGDTYDIVDLLTIPYSPTPSDGLTSLIIHNIKVTNQFSSAGTALIYFKFCQIGVGFSPLAINSYFDSCHLSGGNISLYTGFGYFQGCIIKRFLRGRAGNNIFLFNNLLTGSTASIQLGTNISDAGTAYVSSLGCYNCGTAFALDMGARVFIITGLYGTGNTTVLNVTRGAMVSILTPLVPAVTGTTQIALAGGANQIPRLVAGAAVPASSTLTTFAQWDASPFSRFVVSFLDGSTIMGA